MLTEVLIRSMQKNDEGSTLYFAVYCCLFMAKNLT